jgi:hypothetical protein
METSRFKQLILSGERVLLPFSIGLLLFSALLPISVCLHWPQFLRGLGLIGLFLSPVFLILSCWEAWRYQHRWRTILAVLISLLATAIGWVTLVLRVTVQVSVLTIDTSGACG